MYKRLLTYHLVCLLLVWGGIEYAFAGILELSPLRQVASIEQVADTACPQSFRLLFCTGLISSANCQLCKSCMGDTMPDYYCDCVEGIPFRFGLDTVIADTVWYTAKVSDILNNGMVAYWFSNSAVSIDLFVSCNLKRPNKQIELYNNSSRIMSPDNVKEMLGNVGEIGGIFGSKPVYIRVAPRSEGRVLIYKYGDSFASECGDGIFPVYYGIQYALGHEKVVYRMPRTKVRNLQFINWIQSDNEPVNLDIVRGDCLTGDTVASVVLTDSVYPYIADKALLEDVYNKKDSLYFHFSGSSFGKIIFRNTAKYPASYQTETDTVLCQGARFDNGAIVNSDTVFRDTMWIKLDTLALRTTNVTMASPEPVMDTMLLKTRQLYFFYHGQFVSAFGDYDVTEHIEGGCDARYLLHVEHDWEVIVNNMTITECSGKNISLNGKTYTSNTTLKDTVDNYSADTRTITTYTLVFTSPALEYDTIHINRQQLPFKYEGKYVYSFGDTVMTITKRNTCTRKIRLTVAETKLPMQYKDVETDTTVCAGMGLDFMISDIRATVSGVYKDSILIAEDTMLCVVYHLSVAPADTLNDTLYVMQRELPLQYADTMITEYGDYGVYVSGEDTCDIYVRLAVMPETEYIIYQPVDTVLCHGSIFSIDDRLFTEDTLLVDTLHLDKYVEGVRTFNVTFLPPEPEQITLTGKESEMPLSVYDTLLYYGTHKLLLPGSGGCDRLLLVDVTPEDEFLMSYRDTSVCFGKTIAINGVAYMRDTVVVDTAQMSEHTWQCTTWRLSFAIPEIQYDTLTVSADGLPVTYADTVISAYGTYQVVLAADGECDMLVELTVVQSTGINHVRSELGIVPTMAKTGELVRMTLPDEGLLEVYDVLGREVMTEHLPAGVMPLRINAAGNYIVQLKTRDSILTRRIIITN